jgi:hypothetical protein
MPRYHRFLLLLRDSQPSTPLRDEIIPSHPQRSRRFSTERTRETILDVEDLCGYPDLVRGIHQLRRESVVDEDVGLLDEEQQRRGVN